MKDKSLPGYCSLSFTEKQATQNFWEASLFAAAWEWSTSICQSLLNQWKFYLNYTPVWFQVRETQVLSSENCTTSGCRDATQTFSTRGRTSFQLCTDSPTAPYNLCHSSNRGLYLAEIFLWKSFFVLFPTQTSSVSKGSSIENSLNSGMWNHFCSFNQAHKLVVLFSHLCISITHLRKPVKMKHAISKPQRQQLLWWWCFASL